MLWTSKNLLRFFETGLASEGSRETSRLCGQLAREMVETLQENSELEAGIRKLLEAKTIFARAQFDERIGRSGRVVLDDKNLMRFFEYQHLPVRLQEVSRPCRALAHKLAEMVSEDVLAAGLRKLLEAKDCFVRARLDGPRSSSGGR